MNRFSSLLLPEAIQGPTKPPMQKSDVYVVGTFQVGHAIIIFAKLAQQTSIKVNFDVNYIENLQVSIHKELE